MPRIAGEARRRFPHAGWNLYGITFTAERHWAALEYAQNHSGVSARELVETFRRVNGTKEARRAGPEKRLKWRAKRTLEDMCRDAWNWEPHRRRAAAKDEVSAL